MYSKDSQTFCFHLRLTKNFPIADLEQGLESRSPHHVPCPPLLSIGRDCLSWMDFPGWVRLTEMTPSWRTQTSSSSLLSLHCTGLSHVLFNSDQVLGSSCRLQVLNKCQLPWWFERENIKRLRQSREGDEGLPQGNPECTTVWSTFILQKVWRRLEKGLEG